jgi:hypothetical protein
MFLDAALPVRGDTRRARQHDGRHLHAREPPFRPCPRGRDPRGTEALACVGWSNKGTEFFAISEEGCEMRFSIWWLVLLALLPAFILLAGPSAAGGLRMPAEWIVMAVFG